MSLNSTGVQPSALERRISLSDRIKQHPLIAFFTIAFAGAWIFILPLVFSQRGLGLISLPDPLLLALFLLATYMGPAPAAFIVTGIIEGKAGMKQLLRRMAQWRIGIRWYLIVLVGYPLISLLGLIVFNGGAPISTLIQNWPLLLTSYLPAVAIGMIYPGLGEEPGWRGFALPRMQAAYGPLVASLGLGTLHALWHLPVYFIPGTISDSGFDPVVFFSNSLAIVAVTIIWTWLFNNAKASILFAMFFHAASNANSGAIPGLFPTSNANQFFIFGVMGTVALIIVIATKGKLSYKAVNTAMPVQAEAPREAAMPVAAA